MFNAKIELFDPKLTFENHEAMKIKTFRTVSITCNVIQSAAFSKIQRGRVQEPPETFYDFK